MEKKGVHKRHNARQKDMIEEPSNESLPF